MTVVPRYLVKSNIIKENQKEADTYVADQTKTQTSTGSLLLDQGVPDPFSLSSLFMEFKTSSRPRSIKKIPLFYRLSIFFLSFLVLFSGICSVPTSQGRSCCLSDKADMHNFQELERRDDQVSLAGRWGISMSMGRRLLGGPGSSPPRCTSKCGSCRPCTPVHVPVPPGTPVASEYYPEAWRCKCGNKLYMP